jgi:hypothetical protein
MQGSMQGDSERSALLAEKLQQQKRKNAELKAQVSALEVQITQMTQRVQQLHALHASSSAELVAQTKHACEAAASRLAQEAEARYKHDAAVTRQAASEALDAERAFHISLVRKVETLQQLFPELLQPTSADTDTTLSSSHSGASLLPRSTLNAFFESTRHALHFARQTREELSEARDEVRLLRLRAPLEEAQRFAVQRHVAQMSERITTLQAELLPHADGETRTSGLLRQRDEIIAQVSAVERRIQAARTAKQAALMDQPPTGETSVPAQPVRQVRPASSTSGPRSNRSPAQRTEISPPRPAAPLDADGQVNEWREEARLLAASQRPLVAEHKCD